MSKVVASNHQLLRIHLERYCNNIYKNKNRTAITDNKWYEQGVKYTVGRSLKTTAGRLRSSCYHLLFLDFQLYIRLLFSFLFLYETLFFFIICICRVLVLTAAFLFLGCNRNGICATSTSCESRCNCNWFWEGKCCERRRPRRWWGDPHLETLDGLYIVLNLLGYLLVNLCMIRELYSQDSMLCHPS